MKNIQLLIERSRYAVGFVLDLASEEYGYVDLGSPRTFAALSDAVAPGRVLVGVVGFVDGLPKFIPMPTPCVETCANLIAAVSEHFDDKVLDEYNAAVSDGLNELK